MYLCVCRSMLNKQPYRTDEQFVWLMLAFFYTEEWWFLNFLLLLLDDVHIWEPFFYCFCCCLLYTWPKKNVPTTNEWMNECREYSSSFIGYYCCCCFIFVQLDSLNENLDCIVCVCVLHAQQNFVLFFFILSPYIPSKPMMMISMIKQNYRTRNDRRSDQPNIPGFYYYYFSIIHIDLNEKKRKKIRFEIK